MIEMHLTVDEATRTRRGCAWTATSGVYSASSRSSALHKLARILVDVGESDQPVSVMRGDRTILRYRSLHAMARFTIAESATRPIGLTKFTEMPQFSAR